MRITAAVAYEIWARSYASEPNPVLTLESRTLTELLERRKPKQMLDVACGTGRWSLHYRHLGTRVIGIDASPQMLAQAAKQQLLKGCLIHANVEALPVRDGIADLVLCSMSIGYFPNLSKAFKEFARTATEDGTVAVSDLHPAAIEAGWTRSFKRDGQRFEIDHECYSLADIERAGGHAGLQMTHCHSAYFADSEIPIFKAAGKESAFETIRKTPALLISIWKHRC